MGLAEKAVLAAELSLKGNFSSQLKAGERALGSFDKKLDATQGRAYKAGQQIGTGIQNGIKIAAVGLGILAANVGLGLASLVKLEDAMLQTEAVIKSTGGAAGVTADDVRKLAEKFESLNARVGDEFIQSAENMLLTFTNVRKDAFEPALEAILNLNTALGKGPEGLTNTALVVGKALNDPTKGLLALKRAGVQFTDAQIKQIKALQKSGDLLGAQKIILAELDKEFGKSFIAQGSGTGGKVAKFTDSIEDLQRALATALLPAISKIADKLSKFLADPKVIDGVSKLGEKIASLFNDENINAGVGLLKGFFETAKSVAPAISAAAEVTGKVVSTAVNLFKSLPPEIQALAIGGLAVNKLTGGLVTNIAGGLISSVLKQLVSGVVNVQGAVVNVTGAAGVPGVGAAGGKGGGLLGTISKIAIPVAIVAIGSEAALAISGINDPQHQRPGAPSKFGGNTFRGDNRESVQIRHVRDAIKQLEQRAAAGDQDAVRKLDQQRALLARLLAKTAVSVSREGLIAAETRRVRSSVNRLPHKTTNIINITSKNYMDSRVISANLERYRKATGSGQ